MKGRIESSPVSIGEVRSRGDLRTFIRLPYQLHRSHAFWVPPLLADERALFVRPKNPALRYCDLTLGLAYRGDNVCGRIAGIVNHRYNRHRHERTARFAWLECQNDVSVAEALLAYVTDWAKKQGMTKIVGPMAYGPETGSAWIGAGSSPRIEARDNGLTTCPESWTRSGSW